MEFPFEPLASLVLALHTGDLVVKQTWCSFWVPARRANMIFV